MAAPLPSRRAPSALEIFERDLSRRDSLKLMAGFAGAASLGGFLAACATSTPPTPSATGSPAPAGSASALPSASAATEDGTVTVLIPGFGNERFDPQSMNGVALYQYFLANLTAQRNGKIFPSIATDWQQSADGLSWTFTIRDDILFQDGTPLTVDDVVFSLQDTFSKAAIDTALSDTNATMARLIQSIESTAPNTVTVTHTSPQAYFGYFTSEYQCQIFSKAYFQKVGREGFDTAPIGAGPFKIVTYQPGQAITMERFDQYFDTDRKPHFKTMRFELVAELATRVQSLAAGEADIIEADLSVKDQIESGGNRIVYAPENSWIECQFRGAYDPKFAFHDRNVRLALDLAVDKSLIMGQLYGQAWTNAGFDFVSPSSLGYSPDFMPRAADPTQAKALLAQAGFPGGSGFPKLVINTGDVPEVPRIPDFAQLVAQQWQQVLGIQVEVRLGEINTLKDQAGAGAFNGQMFIRGNDARYDGGTFMDGRYRDLSNTDHLDEDPAIVAAVKAATGVTKAADQQAAYNAAYKLIRDGVYTINTGSLAKAYGVASKLTGWTPYGLQEKLQPLESIQLT